MFYQTDSPKSAAIKATFCGKVIGEKDELYIKDENYQPNQQVNMNKINKKDINSSLDCVTNVKETTEREMLSKETEELNIVIRRVGMEDHLSIVKLFQVK